MNDDTAAWFVSIILKCACTYGSSTISGVEILRIGSSVKYNAKTELYDGIKTSYAMPTSAWMMGVEKAHGSSRKTCDLISVHIKIYGWYIQKVWSGPDDAAHRWSTAAEEFESYHSRIKVNQTPRLSEPWYGLYSDPTIHAITISFSFQWRCAWNTGQLWHLLFHKIHIEHPLVLCFYLTAEGE